MKPRLYKWLGIWFCYTFDGKHSRTGLGYTPDQAYADWLTR